MGNHDNKRVASRFGQDMVDPINTLVMLLPGTAITYNGEEIGMADGTVRWDQTVDPWGKSGGMAKYEMTSRDPFRTPFQWNDLHNAGKSIGNVFLHTLYASARFPCKTYTYIDKMIMRSVGSLKFNI
jgi:alpha-glucosidase